MEKGGGGKMECLSDNNRKKKSSLVASYPTDVIEVNRRASAQRYLEENVRKYIGPRIFPMETTSMMMMTDRVPTPFAFAPDIYLRQQTRRPALAMVTTSITEAEYNYVYSNGHHGNLNYRGSIEEEAGRGLGLTFGLGGGGMMSSPSRTRSREGHGSGSGGGGHHNYRSDFASTLKKWSAPIPPVLLRKLGRVSESPLGKVKVMLKVCDVAEEVSGMGILGVDQRKKQVVLHAPSTAPPAGITPEERRVGVSAPKMFAFDGIFAEDDDQAEICAASAAELVASVVGGEDGCFLSLGYCTAGKAQTLFGRPANQKMGVVPTAVSWLFKSIQEQKQKTGSRFSVRVSAVEVTGGSGHEVINDLLLPFVKDEDQPPSALLDSQNGRGKNSLATAPVLNNVSEVRAPNPETAGFYLDVALNAMNKEDPIRHFIYTLHVYQYTVDKNGKGAVVGGRSRLHCVMLGNGSPSISVLGGLLLAVLNGQRHLPSRDSKLGAILRECLGSLTCRAVVMIHVSNAHSRYAETLAALQLGSRVHRLRRSRRLKMGSVGSGNGSGSSGSGEEMRMNNCSTTVIVGPGASSSLLGEVDSSLTGSSDIDPSSSEQSCDTVIYLGPSIDDATDGEHPPVYLPSLDSNGENGIIVPGKCSLSENGTLGLPPKTKSPKPKSSKVVVDASNFSNVASKSEEKWVDGPKVSKSYRQMSNGGLSSGSGSGSGGSQGLGGGSVKKSETWIDGPAARVHVQHQASNFPSPKKSVQNHHKRGGILGPGDSSPCSISSAKAQMIQKWISNQAHSFLDDHHSSHMDDGSSLSSLSSFFGSSCHGGGGGLPPQSSLYSGMPAVSPFESHFPYSSILPGSFSSSMSMEPEYKALTVFKTCDDLVDEETIKDECIGNGFEFEFIEVVEPEVPVPTRDACLQVTEEDIAASLSFLEVESIENPLPESDQNYFSSSLGNHHHHHSHHRGRSTSFSEGPQQQPTTPVMSEEKYEDHPLRVLSQECLTVVSTFTDSSSIGGGDIDHFWPRLSYTDEMTIQDIHEMGMCHGLCKNLVSLSQMSLTHDTQHHNGNGPVHHHHQHHNHQQHQENPYGILHSETQNHTRFHSMGRIDKTSSRPTSKSPLPSKQDQLQIGSPPQNPTTTSLETPQSHGGGGGGTAPVQIKSTPPDEFSDDSIFKIPKSPINPKTTFGSSCSTQAAAVTSSSTKKTKDMSDAEQDTISIPPMKLLDLTPIRNNSNLSSDNPVSSIPPPPPTLHSCPGNQQNQQLSSRQSSIHLIPSPPSSQSQAQSKTNPHHQNYPNPTLSHQHPHKGCDHNHHNPSTNGSISLQSPPPSVTSPPPIPSPSIQMLNGTSQLNGHISPNISASSVIMDTPPSSPLLPTPDVVLTKSPSKSKSRKIAKFFRSRSKSPKTAGTTSSESSGKSSGSSSDTKLKLSSSSSCSSGASSTTSPASKLPPLSSSSPKKMVGSSSPSKKSILLSLSSATKNGTNLSMDYQYTCDSSQVPMFAPMPTTIAE